MAIFIILLKRFWNFDPFSIMKSHKLDAIFWCAFKAQNSMLYVILQIFRRTQMMISLLKFLNHCVASVFG